MSPPESAVSRVLSRLAAAVVIHLGPGSLLGSSDQPGSLRAGHPGPRLSPGTLPTRSCFRWGLPCGPCCQGPGALLPRLFTLTASLAAAAVCFLWHFPSGHPDRPLAGTLPCEARTFLSHCHASGHLTGSGGDPGNLKEIRGPGKAQTVQDRPKTARARYASRTTQPAPSRATSAAQARSTSSAVLPSSVSFTRCPSAAGTQRG